MTPQRIKEIRALFGITQEDLAVILGVTKTTVGRYEIGQAKPVGDAEKKLLQLENALQKPEEKNLVAGLLQSNGKAAGVAALGALLSLGTAVLPLPLLGTGTGLAAALSSQAGRALFTAMKKIMDAQE